MLLTLSKPKFAKYVPEVPSVTHKECFSITQIFSTTISVTLAVLTLFYLCDRTYYEVHILYGVTC